MLRRRVLIGHVSGIPVRIDYRWFVVFFVLALIVASNIPASLVDLNIVRFLLGLATVVVFFFSLFLHELAHAVIARREGIGVLEIVLHPFGGVAQLQREPENPGSEFRIALAGPAASFLISLIFLSLYLLSTHWNLGVLTPIFFLLFLLNLLLAVFNLFPVFPLDGGRVLRAILRKRGMEMGEATKLTGKFGQLIGFALVFIGIAFMALSGDAFTGLWSIIVGLFLLDAATGFIRGVESFEHLTVERVMEMPVAVSPDITVMECVDKVISYHRQIVFPVAEKRELYGFLVLEDVKNSLSRNEWHKTFVREVMRAVREEYFVELGVPVTEAKELLRINKLGALGVVDGEGKLVGFIQRGRIRRRN
jgi:Zn-dependent protease